MTLSCIVSHIKRDIGRKLRLMPRDAIHSAIYTVVRCLFASGPSVAFVLCVETSKDILTLFTVQKTHYSSFSSPNAMAIFGQRPPNRGVEYKWGMKKFAILDHHHHHHIRFISETIQDRATVIMKCQFELVCDLHFLYIVVPKPSNGSISNDLE